MSFKKTYYKYYPELVRYGRQLNVNEADIEDLVQETFMKYHIELGKDVVFENSRAWLYKVLHNQVMTKNNSKSLRESKLKYFRTQHADRFQTDTIEKDERRELVFQILEKLPDKEKNLLLLYHNGLKYKEIAEVLDMNPNSVGTIIVRSMAKLKKLLKTEYHELFR